MSHELRTPLNSLLILSDQLSKNPEGNLTSQADRVRQDDPLLRQRPAHAHQRHSRPVEDRVGHGHRRCRRGPARRPARLRRADLPPRGRVEERSTSSSASIRSLPKSMFTDAKRLQQIIKNLLSNAFKFTHQGQVTLSVEPVQSGWNPTTRISTAPRKCWPSAVSDTGIGISPDKQQIIFEAFQQADGSTSRKYGGTGLGLAISRELSRLLGGEIRLASSPGRGSTFILYLPTNYSPTRGPQAARQRRCRIAAARFRPLAALSSRMSRNGSHVLERRSPTSRRSRPFDRLGETVIVRKDEQRRPATGQRGRRRPRLHPAGRPRAAHRRKRPGLRPLPARHGPRKGLQGTGHLAGRRRPGLDARVQARCHHPGHLPAGHRRLARLERLKNDIATRHIPVCVISTDDAREQAFVVRCRGLCRQADLQPRRARRAARPAAATSSAGPRRRCCVVETDAERVRPHPRVASMPRTSRSSRSPTASDAPADCCRSSASIAWCMSSNAGDLAEYMMADGHRPTKRSSAGPTVIVYGDGQARR